MLTKDLLRVSRAGGGYRPRFVGREARPLAARVVGAFRDHAGDPRERLDATLESLEADADDFKLVRGFAALLEREATFETRAAVPPERARRAAFAAAEAAGGVVTEDERAAALADAADGLAVSPDAVADSLYADREPRQVLTEFDARWDPDQLVAQYDLSLAQTALFDATEVRVRSSDPRTLVSAVKRLRLMYEVRRTDGGPASEASGTSSGSDTRTDGGREVVVTGPDALFRRTRRYGTAFARLLRTVAKSASWTLTATIDDRGTEREMTLSDADVSVPSVDPVVDPSTTFDSGVEADFAARFESLDLDWDLAREPEPLAVADGTRVMIPDFAFDYRPAGVASDASSDEPGGDRPTLRVFFEIMGFWTPEYVEKKLGQLADVEDVELVVAVDESLGVGEEVAARDHRAVPYSGSVRVKDVVDVLREYETDLVDRAAAALPAELVPDADAVSLSAVAADRGVSEDALADVTFPEHERVGRTLVRPSVLDDLRAEIAPGMTLSDAEAALEERGVDDASAALSALGYRVEWEGLSGGTVREKGE